MNFNKEGDVNFSERRQKWQNELSNEVKTLIDLDDSVFLSQSMSTPCMEAINRVEGSYIINTDGKEILDFHGNSLHQVGHSNKFIIDALKNQLDDLTFIPRRYTAKVAIDAARALINKTNSKDYKVLFTPSGTVSIELAMKLTRKITGKSKIISMWESFHGATLASISAGGQAVFKKDLGSLPSGFVKGIPFKEYQPLIESSNPIEISEFCINYLEYVIKNEGDIGGILLEPIRATETHRPPKTYFKALRNLCDKHGILLIFDEIPTAFGRSGEFYVHQNFSVEPDILVLGKGIGGGIIPQGAILAKKKYDIAEDISLGHYTHEKPALGSAAILATINYIDEHHLIKKVKEKSNYVSSRLYSLKESYSFIDDIRIQGLLISIEIHFCNREFLVTESEFVEEVFYRCLKKGLSFKIANGNCITWHPPLTVSKNELEKALLIFEKSICEATKIYEK